MEEALPSSVFSRPAGFPKASVVDPESSRPGTATSANWFSGPDDLGWPLRSVWILRRSSWTPETSPPLLRRTCSSTSPYRRRSRQWPAAWHQRTSPNSCVRFPPHSHGVDGPLSLRLSLLSSWGPRTQRSRLCCQHRCAMQQPPPRPGLQAEVLSSFGESGGPCLVAPAHQPARIMGYRYCTRAAPSPCTLVETAQSPPVAQSVPCADATITC